MILPDFTRLPAHLKETAKIGMESYIQALKDTKNIFNTLMDSQITEMEKKIKEIGL